MFLHPSILPPFPACLQARHPSSFLYDFVVTRSFGVILMSLFFISSYHKMISSYQEMTFLYVFFIFSYQEMTFLYGFFIFSYQEMTFLYGFFIFSYQEMTFLYGFFIFSSLKMTLLWDFRKRGYG